MANTIYELAKQMGGTVVTDLPDVGSGAFGAWRLSHVVAELQNRLTATDGDDASKVSQTVLINSDTLLKLNQLSREASKSGKAISPMQVASQLLEAALATHPG